MRIEKFKKNKDNSYTVYFDNSLSLKLYDDVIVKYNLLVNKEMDDKKLLEVTNYNDFLNGYYKAIKYILKRLRSEKEVHEYLKKLDIKESDIKKIISILKKDGYINEENYIKSYINDQINLTLNGPDKIKKNLIGLGFSEENIEDYLSSFNDWNERIDRIINKKIKINNNLGKNKLKNKIINDIINMGYKKSDIVLILDNKDIDDNTILKKELFKAIKRFENKYPDNLKYKVRDYLYKKGFSIDDIEKEMGDYYET